MEIKTGTKVQIETTDGVIQRTGQWHHYEFGERVVLGDGTTLGTTDLLTRFYVIQWRDDLLRLGQIEDGEQHVSQLTAENEALRARLADLDALTPDADYRDRVAEVLFHYHYGENIDWATTPGDRKESSFGLADQIVALRTAYQDNLLNSYERIGIRARELAEENETLRAADTTKCIRYRHEERLVERWRIIERQERVLTSIDYDRSTGSWRPDPATVSRIAQLEMSLTEQTNLDEIRATLDAEPNESGLDAARRLMAERKTTRRTLAAMLDERQDVTNGVKSIQVERRRQIIDGFDSVHDDQHTTGQLLLAARCYVVAAMLAERNTELPTLARRAGHLWPWQQSAWNPSTDPLRNVIKAGALLAAEADRLERLKFQ